MAKPDEAITVVKTLDEHPLVVALRAEVAKLTREKYELGEERNAIVRKRDEKYVADGIMLRQQVLDLQNKVVELQDRLLAIRRAAL
jgi:hypothetical protein